MNLRRVPKFHGEMSNAGGGSFVLWMAGWYNYRNLKIELTPMDAEILRILLCDKLEAYNGTRVFKNKNQQNVNNQNRKGSMDANFETINADDSKEDE